MSENGAHSIQQRGSRFCAFLALTLSVGAIAQTRPTYSGFTERPKLSPAPAPAVAKRPNLPFVDEPIPSATGTTAPQSGSRIVRLETNGDTPVLLPLVKGFPSVVEFPKGEKVMDIAVGGMNDWSLAWEVVKRDSAFFIKPLAAAQLTTLIVGTSERHYVFDLQPLAASPDNHARRLSRLILLPVQAPINVQDLAQSQQQSQQAQTMRQAQEKATQIEAQIKALKEARLAQRKRNFQYTMEVVSLADDIRPREAFDDGRFTYLKFPNALQIPAVYRGGKTAADETLMNSHIEEDYLVLHGVHTHWVLRLGGSVIGVHNEAFDPVGVSTHSGTSTIAERVVK